MKRHFATFLAINLLFLLLTLIDCKKSSSFKQASSSRPTSKSKLSSSSSLLSKRGGADITLGLEDLVLGNNNNNNKVNEIEEVDDKVDDHNNEVVGGNEFEMILEPNKADHLTSVTAGSASSSSSSTFLFPYCSELVFTNITGYDSYINFQAMFDNCVNNSPSALLNPAYLINKTIIVSTQFAIDNLIQVDDLNNLVTLDFYFRLTWTDPRLRLPTQLFYKHLPHAASRDGVAVSDMGFSDYFWTPDMTFTDAQSVEVIAETIKWRLNGTIYWSRHLVATFIQANMNFTKYPMDTQTFYIRFESYAYVSALYGIEFTNTPNSPPVVLINNSEVCSESNPECSAVKANQLWKYSGYNSYNVIDPQPTTYYPERAFEIGVVELTFARQSTGILNRLALPVMMLLIIVGVSFLVGIEMQIDVAMNMLLVVAALYLVIGSTIPFVGYLSKMDIYITATFTLLGLTLFLYFISVKLESSGGKYPARLFLKVILLWVLRVVWMPIIFTLFYTSFNSKDLTGKPSFISLTVILISAGVINGFANLRVVKEEFIVMVLSLRQKRKEYNEEIRSKNPLAQDLTLIEKLVLTVTRGKWTRREQEENEKKGGEGLHQEIDDPKAVPAATSAREIQLSPMIKHNQNTNTSSSSYYSTSNANSRSSPNPNPNPNPTPIPNPNPPTRNSLSNYVREESNGSAGGGIGSARFQRPVSIIPKTAASLQKKDDSDDES